LLIGLAEYCNEVSKEEWLKYVCEDVVLLRPYKVIRNDGGIQIPSHGFRILTSWISLFNFVDSRSIFTVDFGLRLPEIQILMPWILEINFETKFLGFRIDLHIGRYNIRVTVPIQLAFNSYRVISYWRDMTSYLYVRQLNLNH
jgi:hypothetical protein